MNEQQIEISLNVTLQECNVILEALGGLKLNEVYNFYHKVRGQAEAQVKANSQNQPSNL